MRQKCVVKLQYGTYEAEVIVFCNGDDESDYIKSKAWKQVKADFLPMAYTSATIISREDLV
jgi:hypothetical protein